MTLLGDETDTAAPDPSASVSSRFPVVGVGASAGGLEAYSQLLAALTPDIGMAFVLVQHLDPDHPSALTDIPVSYTHLTLPTSDLV